MVVLTIFLTLYLRPDFLDNKTSEAVRDVIDNQLAKIGNDNWRSPRVVREDNETGTNYYVYGTVTDIGHIYYDDPNSEDGLIEAGNEWMMMVKLATGATVPIHFGLDPRGTFLGNVKTLVITDNLSEPFKVGDIVKLKLNDAKILDSMAFDFLLPQMIILDKKS